MRFCTERNACTCSTSTSAVGLPFADFSGAQDFACLQCKIATGTRGCGRLSMAAERTCKPYITTHPSMFYSMKGNSSPKTFLRTILSLLPLLEIQCQEWSRACCKAGRTCQWMMMASWKTCHTHWMTLCIMASMGTRLWRRLQICRLLT